MQSTIDFDVMQPPSYFHNFNTNSLYRTQKDQIYFQKLGQKDQNSTKLGSKFESYKKKGSKFPHW